MSSEGGDLGVVRRSQVSSMRPHEGESTLFYRLSSRFLEIGNLTPESRVPVTSARNRNLETELTLRLRDPRNIGLRSGTCYRRDSTPEGVRGFHGNRAPRLRSYGSVSGSRHSARSGGAFPMERCRCSERVRAKRMRSEDERRRRRIFSPGRRR